MKKFIIPILVLFISVSAFSQHRGDKFKKLKIPFISERVNLTPDEAEKFWPIYNAYEEASSKLRHEKIRSIHREIKDNRDGISETKAKELLENLTKYENELQAEELKLIKQLQKIISNKKIILLKMAEEDFKKRLFDRYVNKKIKHRMEKEK
ncbi:sensor of ECF-type sigma factor [Flavisericum labens]|uniref:sensor of ECF-type sigma factor n=1 Tax=Flavisericum labens TaxID=3377112 RepID=UPI00387B33F8